MPGRFEGQSEYDRSYLWPGLTKQKKRSASAEGPYAGKRSTTLHVVNEPPFQHKRRGGPGDSLALQQPELPTEDDYFLIGNNNEKFAPSLPYRNSRKAKEYPYEHREGSRSRERSRSLEAPRREKTLKAGPVDVEVRGRPTTKGRVTHAEPRVPDKRNVKVGSNLKKEMRDVAVETTGVGKGHRQSTSLQERRDRNQAAPAPGKSLATEKKQYEDLVNQVRRERSIEKKPEHRERIRDKYKDSTKLDRYPEQPYQPATVPSRQSEYKYQYDWKNRVAESPVVKADDIIHRSHLSLPKNAKMPVSTEYGRQFKPFKYVAEENIRQGKRHRDDNFVERVPYKVAPKPRRTSSPPPRVLVHGEEYGPSDVLNPQRASFPLGRQKSLVSEYSAKYRNYWDKSVDKTKWFDEILEMRSKAEEYRKRSRGTHFSREHVGQLLSENNTYWNLPSSSRASNTNGYQDSPAGVRKKQAWSSEEEESFDVDSPSKRQASKVHHESRPPPQQQQPRSASACVRSRESSHSPPRVPPTVKGRLPTPDASPFSRHHLDRTTPSVGGAILTAPNRSSSVSSSSDTVKAEPMPRREVQKRIPQNPVRRYAAGKPSLDAGNLLDEEASHDTPIRGYHSGVRSSQRPLSAVPLRNGHGQPRAVNGHNEVYFDRLSIDSYNNAHRVDNNEDDADDMRSLSVRSLVSSSSSLASETLERARKRRDEFWGAHDVSITSSDRSYRS